MGGIERAAQFGLCRHELLIEGLYLVALLDRLLLLFFGHRSVGDGLLFIGHSFPLIRNGLLFVGVGLCLGCCSSRSLPGADGGAENEADSDCGGSGESWFVLPGEFVKAVHGSWRASEDRFVGKITLNVGGKAAGRFV